MTVVDACYSNVGNGSTDVFGEAFVVDRRSTIRDVAQRAGVAIGTVSRALNGSGAVHPATLARIRDAMADLDFRPNAAGRSLRSGASRAFGVLVPTLSNPIFALSLDGIEDRAKARGFSVVVTASAYDPQREDDAIAGLAARGVEGLILTVSHVTPDLLDRIARHGLPFVLLYNQSPDKAADAIASVSVDGRGAVRDATDRLIAFGHRRIAFLGGAFAASDRALARYRGYRDAMVKAGLPVWEAEEVPFLDEGPAFDVAVAALLTRLAAPTALICSNDLLGLHAVAAARRLGLSVPDDLSVIGFDGLPMARIVEPSLTSIAQPARAMGAAATDLLFDRIAGAPPEAVILPHAFLPGGTLAPVRLAARQDADPQRAGPASTPQR